MRTVFLIFIFALTTAPLIAQKHPTSKHKRPTPASASALPPAAVAAMASIDPQRIRAHVKFLSSDLLEGRGTGQRGGDIAAEYIATQFESYGLKPAGDNGAFLQKVPMVGITTEPSTNIYLLQAGKTEKLKLGDEIVAMDETQNAADDLDADLVFVGYGIEAPEYQWNDFKDADVRGKVLLMFVNEPNSDDPKFFKGKALTYYGRWTYKYEQAARKGALGVMLIHQADMASYGWDVVQNSWGGERSYLRADGQPKLKLASWIQLELARKLLANSGQDLDALFKQADSRDFKPIPLPVRVQAHLVSKIRPFESQNVLAMLPGSDPRLKDQAVIYSAHYDHLGIHSEQPGDNIYNGAVDNATGCGVLLELAHAYAASAQHPKRSILFASVTGEEQGLRGSEFLGKHPPIPAGNISLGLNFDGIAPNGIPQEVSVSGAERTTFYPTVEATAKELNLAIKPDSNPSAGYYYRSDHFSFARVGIPSFSVNEGMKFKGHPLAWGIQQEREYNAKHYHQPSDEFKPDWDFSGPAEMARFGFRLGWKAASQPQGIGWQLGDEFEAARKASLQSLSRNGVR
ncbi:MAG: M28 family peptidase [Acidobacteriia bacterium]|nr:M28 family peptidase [Terriglobia bacterium]